MYSYKILDSESEAAYDNLTMLAAQICDTPVALITLLDPTRQWFKSALGIEIKETCRDVAFCDHAIKEKHRVTAIEDATKDARFAENPFVTEAPYVRFYAGAPILTPEGEALGTVCVIDTKPRKLSERAISTLQKLADQVMMLLELRKRNQLLIEEKNRSEAHISELEKFAYIVSHDLKSPLNNIFSLSSLLKDACAERLEESELRSLDFILESASSLGELIEGILHHYKSDSLPENEEETDLVRFFDKTTQLFGEQAQFTYAVPPSITKARFKTAPTQQILINLISNGINYNDAAVPQIDIIVNACDIGLAFSVTDNGRGIAEKDKEKIFELFTTLHTPDRDQRAGTGIGLATVQKLVHKSGGTIQVKSSPNDGSTFTFSIPASTAILKQTPPKGKARECRLSKCLIRTHLEVC